MKKLHLFIGLMMALTIVSCYNDMAVGDQGAIYESTKLQGDITRYGLACDGCSDSVIVFLPSEGGDPVKYNIVRAMNRQKVFGDIEIGDELAVIVNPNDKNEAIMVFNLEQMKGTWTFQVVPKLKPSNIKTEEQILASMSDSLKKALFLPREYGFTLKSYNQASPVGYIMKANSLADESPVEYPKVTIYTGWRIYNGWLYIFKDTLDEEGKRIPNHLVGHDDGIMVHLSADSMAAKFGKKIMKYHRKKNAIEANREAQEAEKKASQKDTLKL
ncbi:hypothetical protein [Prevotella ihumii]|uniref:hypothetical protein n=1 Tax=Prevotella ihumii TaxID=1917878 RepID=UPI000980D2C0|nr:hypothetical protein [Prevotella ihumii]